MAIQLKRQGAVNAASCSDSPLKPTSLAYGEPAIDSAGYLYIGDGSGKVVSRVRYADDCATSSTSDFASYANNSGALQDRKIGSGIWSSTTEFIPYVNKWGIMEVGKQIDFHEDENSSADWNIKLSSSDNALHIVTTDYKFAEVKLGELTARYWLTTQDNQGWRNSTYGGGWYMSDSSFIRAYGDKAVYTNSTAGGQWIKATRNAAFTVGKAATGGAAQGYLSMKTASGSWAISGVSGNDSIYFIWASDSDYNANNNGNVNLKISFDNNGYIHAGKVYNAVYNDYAEFFPRGEETEPGDIIALDVNSDKEQYIKATSNSKKIVGVHSNEYGHLIGGDEAPVGEDFVEYNLQKYIPVGLVGRCKVKIIGKVNKGDDIIPSEIPGVGRTWIEGIDSQDLLKNSIGFAVESSDDKDVKLIKVKLKG